MRVGQPISLHAGRARAIAIPAVETVDMTAGDTASWSPGRRLFFITGSTVVLWATIIMAVKALI